MWLLQQMPISLLILTSDWGVATKQIRQYDKPTTFSQKYMTCALLLYVESICTNYNPDRSALSEGIRAIVHYLDKNRHLLKAGDQILKRLYLMLDPSAPTPSKAECALPCLDGFVDAWGSA